MTTSGPHDPNNPYEPMPAAPPVDPGTTPTATRPRTVTIAFWLWIALSAILLINLIAAFFLDRDALESTLRQAQTGLTDAQLAQAVDLAVVVAIAVPAIFLVAILGCAFPMRSGRNWARIVLTVFGGLLVLLTLLFSAGAIAIINFVIVALILAGIVLMFLRDSNPYFAPRRQ